MPKRVFGDVNCGLPDQPLPQDCRGIRGTESADREGYAYWVGLHRDGKQRLAARMQHENGAHPEPASSHAHLEPRHPSDQAACQAPLAVALGVAGPSAWQPPPVPPSVTNRVEELEEVESTAAKRAKTRPTCPQCRGSNVKTLGGGTRGKYRYTCQSCSANWQQVPPHRLEASAPNEVDSVGLAIRKRTINAPYKCHRCGQPKKGHVCGDTRAGVGEAHDTTGAAHDTEVRARPLPRAHCSGTTPLQRGGAARVSVWRASLRATLVRRSRRILLRGMRRSSIHRTRRKYPLRLRWPACLPVLWASSADWSRGPPPRTL